MQSSHINIRTSAASYADRYPSYPQPSNNSSLTLTRTTPPSHQAGSLGTTSIASKPGSIEGTWYLHRVCRGQIDHISLVAFSRNVQFMVSSAVSGEVIVWDVESGGVVACHLSVRRSSICIACSNDGRRIALSSSYWGAQIEIRDVEKTSLIFNEHSGYIKDVVFSPDDSRIVSRDNSGTSFVWDTASGQAICKLQNPTGLTFDHLHFSDDGKLVVGILARKVHVWDAESGELNPLAKDIASMSFPPDFRWSLWSIFEDGALRKWCTSKHINAISHDSRYLASGYVNKILLYSQEPPPPGEGPVQVDDIPEDRRIMCVFCLTSRYNLFEGDDADIMTLQYNRKRQMVMVRWVAKLGG